MKINIEHSCGLPDKKYNSGWSTDILPTFGVMWVTEDVGDSIDGYRFNTRPAFLVVSFGWLFWSVSFFIGAE